MHPEIFARLAPLPAKVKAVTLTDDCLVFTVIVNANLCERSRQAALNHELNHIYENHFSDLAIPIALAEHLADQLGAAHSILAP